MIISVLGDLNDKYIYVIFLQWTKTTYKRTTKKQTNGWPESQEQDIYTSSLGHPSVIFADTRRYVSVYNQYSKESTPLSPKLKKNTNPF